MSHFGKFRRGLLKVEALATFGVCQIVAQNPEACCRALSSRCPPRGCLPRLL